MVRLGKALDKKISKIFCFIAIKKTFRFSHMLRKPAYDFTVTTIGAFYQPGNLLCAERGLGLRHEGCSVRLTTFGASACLPVPPPPPRDKTTADGFY